MNEMGIAKLNKIPNFELDVKMDTGYVSRETFINKFIEKFPKANLHTLTQINKYYNKKNTDSSTINLDNDFSINSMYDYLSVLN